MKSSLLFLFFIALFSFVSANGQVILDTIEPIKAEKVSFEDPLFTAYGVVEQIATDTFGVTHQFELNVNVGDVNLDSLQGETGFTGSLGAAISSLRGDIFFNAVDDSFAVGHDIIAIANEEVIFSSQAGLITMSTLFPLEVTAGTATIEGDFVTIETSGELSFDAGEMFSINAGGAVSLSSEELFSFEARTGDIYINAADEMVLSSSNVFRLDGTHSVSISTTDSLDLTAGRSVVLHSITSDSLIRDEINIQFNRISLDGDDGVVVGGQRVDILPGSRFNARSDSPGGFVTADFGNHFNVTANNNIIMRTTGETGDVMVSADDIRTSVTNLFSVNTNMFHMGSNSTDNFSISTSTYQFDANFMTMHSDGTIDVTSKASTNFESNDLLVHADTYSLTATGAVATFNSADWNVFNPIGDVYGHGSFSSGSDFDVISSNFDVFGANVDGTFVSQQYNVQSLFVQSVSDRDISFIGHNRLTGSVDDDFIANTAKFGLVADEITLNLLEFDLNALFVDMFISESISFVATGDFDIQSANNFNLNMEDGTFGAVSEFLITASGSARVSAIDVTWQAADDVEIFAQKTIQMITKLGSAVFGGDLTLDSGNNMYFKTSDFILNTGDDISITPNVFSLNMDAFTITSKDLTYDSDSTISILSGGTIAFSSTASMEFNTGDDIDFNIQETVTFDARDMIQLNADSVEIDGSQEFLFSSEDNMTINSDATFRVDSDIYEQLSGDSLSVNAGNLIEFVSGDTQFETLSGELTLSATNDINILSDISFRINTRQYANIAEESLSTASDLTNFNSNDFDVSSSNGDFTIFATDSSIEGWVDSITTTSTTSITGSTLTRFKSAKDDGIHMTSSSTFNVNAIGAAPSDGLNIISEVNASLLAQNTINIDASGILVFNSIESSEILSGGSINGFAPNTLTFDSAEDLGFMTMNGDITFSSQSTQIDVGRDAHILANGIDTIDMCGISFDTSNGNQFALGSDFGHISLESWDDSSFSSSSFFEVSSTGNVFMESLQNGIMYFAEGTTGGISITGTGSSGNVEFLSTAAEFLLFGGEGISFTTGSYARYVGQTGLKFIAVESEDSVDPTVLYAGDASVISSARGTTFAAGLDAPVFDSDISIITDSVITESQDLLHLQSIGTFTSISKNTIEFLSHEGSEIAFSIARDFNLMSTENRYTTLDGDQTYTANDNDLTVNAGSEISIQTNQGPINMEALAGAFTLTSQDWEITSNMDTRALSLGAITLNTSADFLGLSNSNILLQTERAADLISFDSDTIIAIGDSDDTDSLFKTVEILGHNIDINGNTTTIQTTNTGDILIGNDSNPIVTIFASGDGTTPGLQYTTLGPISTNSFIADITSTSTDTLFDLRNNTNIGSMGPISFTSDGDDINLFAENGSVVFGTAISTWDIDDSYDVFADGFTFIQSRVNEDIPINSNDLVSIDVNGDMFVTSSLHQIVTDGLYDLRVGGSVTVNVDDIQIDHGTFDYDPNSFERSSLIVNMNDMTIQAPNGLLSFTTNAPVETPSDIIFSSGDIFIADVTSTFDVQADNVFINAQETIAFSAFSVFTINTVAIDGEQATGFEEESEVYVEGSDVSFTALSDEIIESFEEGSYVDVIDDVFITITAGDLLIENFDNTGYGGDEFSIFELVAEESISFSSLTFNMVTPPLNPYITIDDNQDEFSFVVNSANDVTFGTSAAALATISSDSMLSVTAGSVDINVGNQIDLLSTSGDIIFETTAFESDITLDGVGSTFTFTAPTITIEANEQINFDTPLLTTSPQTLDVNSDHGDIYFSIATTISYDSTGITTIDAFGHQSDNNNGISFITPTQTTTAIGDLTFNAQELMKIFASNSISITASPVSFTTTGLNSPFTWTALEDDISFTATSAININGGHVASIEATSIDLTSGPFSASTSFSRSGIVFDSDPEHNQDTVASFSAAGSTININAINSVVFETDKSNSLAPGIEINTATITITSTEELDFVSEIGDIVVSSQGAATYTSSDDFILEGDNVFLASNAFVLQTTSAFFNAGGDIRFDDNMTPLVLTATDITLDTTTTSRDNHIGFHNSASITVTDANFVVLGNGGDGGILVDADFSTTSTVSFTSNTNPLIIDTESGILIVGTQHADPDTSGILFDAADDVFITTHDARGSIFFQSDNDLIISTTEIHHVRYDARMGFFSETPDWIHLTNMQSTENCLRGSWCGFIDDRVRRGNADTAINNISVQAVAVQNCLKQFGLINWVNPLV